MGNLGKYQDIVTAAKAVGGVENLIGKIETGAVDKAAPGLVAKGAAIGAGVVLGAAAAAAAGKRYWARRKARIAIADDAKDELRVAIDEPATVGSADSRDGEQPDGGEKEA
jgi:hypothetical protein